MAESAADTPALPGAAEEGLLDLRPHAEDLTPALARIYGESLFELPRDLYIPPDALQVILDAFEGPLDLLLYLIRKANINVLDIPMAPLTAQYLEYVEAMRRHDLELAADYLLMAAVLLEIKSRMLLPVPKAEGEESGEDPRAELVRRLLEYEQMKLAGARLDALPRVERDYEWVSVWVAEKVVERLPDLNLHDLQVAWLGLVRRAKLRTPHRIGREELSVREHMAVILRRLDGGAFLPFIDLFDADDGVPVLVVSFLAVLELVKERMVLVSQLAPLEPIYVRLSGSGG
jgi:segregation and condensation protein A